ncbi:MAG: hypothetical protein LCI03_18545 [Actinobacteria bacterium]|jgi:hypothetical protein|nr:hypothetical protein [Actinomycetota bacterium]
MNAALVLAHATANEANTHPELPSKWAFGALALVVLLLLLFIVTRLNVDR